jgi:hypothetical protein
LGEAKEVRPFFPYRLAASGKTPFSRSGGKKCAKKDCPKMRTAFGFDVIAKIFN